MKSHIMKIKLLLFQVVNSHKADVDLDLDYELDISMQR